MNTCTFSIQNDFRAALINGWFEEKENREENKTIVFLKDIHQEVLDFIEDFRDIDEEIFELGVDEERWIDIYTRGNCYFFAKQLSKAFGNAKIWFTDCVGHAVTEIEGVLFDARGLVPYRWSEEFLEENPLFEINGKCWSHDWERGFAGRELYFPTLSQVVNEPIQNYRGHVEDEELEEFVIHMMSEFIYEHMTDNANVVEKAMENGWLDEFGDAWGCNYYY